MSLKQQFHYNCLFHSKTERFQLWARVFCFTFKDMPKVTFRRYWPGFSEDTILTISGITTHDERFVCITPCIMFEKDERIKNSACWLMEGVILKSVHHLYRRVNMGFQSSEKPVTDIQWREATKRRGLSTSVSWLNAASISEYEDIWK